MNTSVVDVRDIPRPHSIWGRLNYFWLLGCPHGIRVFLAVKRQRRQFPVPEEAWASAAPANGFLTRKEAALLFWAARECPVAGPVVELGSYEGRSTILFARAGRRVHAVDAWGVVERPANSPDEYPTAEVLARFHANLDRAGVRGQVSIHQGRTDWVGAAWKEPCALLFVDAGHTYEEIARDLATWGRIVAPGGFLLIHDVLARRMPGVTRATGELLQAGWQVLANSGSLVALVHP